MPSPDAPKKVFKPKMAVAKPSAPPKRPQPAPVSQHPPQAEQAPAARPAPPPPARLVVPPPQPRPVAPPAARPAPPPARPAPVGAQAFSPINHAGARTETELPAADPGIMDLSLKDMEEDVPSPKAPQPKPLQELSPASVAKRQRTETGKLKKMPADDVKKPVIMGKPVSSSALVEAEVERVREMLQNYLEICDSLLHDWSPVSVIDLLHVLARSLGMDVVSLALLDPEKPGKLLPVVSRGYNAPPTADIHAIWEKCLIADPPTVNWSKLMSSTSSPETPLACWILHEDLHKFGYAPIHDGKAIQGFLVTGVHGKGPISPFSSTLLEMLGGRLGLSLALRRGSKGQWPKSVLDTAKTIRDQLSLLMGCVEMLKEASKLSHEEVASLTGNCLRSISESVSLLDRMAAEASDSN